MKALMRKRWFPWARDAAIVLLAYLAIGAYQKRHAARGPLPAVEATLLSGEPVQLASLRGEPMLLHFWATWCGVCKAGQHNIVALAKDHRVLTVASSSGSPEAVQRYAQQTGLDVPIALDPEAKLARQLGVGAFPTSFFVDADGNIAAVETGYTTELGMRLRMWWAAL
jgi:thiol-disulfide isomerase/thioredoxin